jgi:hypothetical protein
MVFYLLIYLLMSRRLIMRSPGACSPAPPLRFWRRTAASAVAAALCGGGGKPPLTGRVPAARLLGPKSKSSVLEGAGAQWDPRGVGRVYVYSERGAEKAEIPLV